MPRVMQVLPVGQSFFIKQPLKLGDWDPVMQFFIVGHPALVSPLLLVMHSAFDMHREVVAQLLSVWQTKLVAQPVPDGQLALVAQPLLEAHKELVAQIEPVGQVELVG
jgi:hypothetical protein